MQIGVNGVNRTTSSAASVNQPITISDITGHTTLSIDFVEAYKMSIAVKDMTNANASSAIYGFAIAQSSKNDVVKAGNDYIVPTNKNISFTVDSTPKGSDVYTYTGLILNDVTKLGVGGGSAGITSAIKTDNLDYADPDVATYEYTITAGTKVESLVVRVALSQNVSIPTGSVSIGKGRITLQSNDGLNFNRVIESDTTNVVLYAGTWTVILDQPESWNLEGLKEVFGENVTQNGDVYTVTIP